MKSESYLFADFFNEYLYNLYAMNLLIILGLFHWMSTSEAVYCWVCDAIGNDQCLKEGDIVTCSAGQVCQNEVRLENNQLRVTKRCKQEEACNNNLMQNSVGLHSQCNTSSSAYVCRCCCSTDECNAEALFCIEPAPQSTKPPSPQAPEGPREGNGQLFTEQEVTTLRESWSMLEAFGHQDFGLKLIIRLLADTTQFRSLFPTLQLPAEGEIPEEELREHPVILDMADSITSSLANVIDLLESPESLKSFLRSLAARGEGNYLLKKILTNFGPKLLATIRQNLRISAQSTTIRAWALVYEIIKKEMLKSHYEVER